MRRLFLAIISIAPWLPCAAQLQQYYWFHGTAIVEYWTKDSIWIAADSKVINDNDYDTPKLACKIRNVGNVYYTLSGNVELKDKANNKTVFDANVDVRRTLNKISSLDDFANQFSKIIIPHLKLGQNGPQSNPNALVQPELQIVVNEIMPSGAPRVITMNFVTMGNSTDIKVDSFDTKRHQMGLHYVATGFSDEIDDFLDKNESYFSTPGTMKDKLTKLINIAYTAHKKDVGLPINIIVIFKNGHKWLSPAGICH